MMTWGRRDPARTHNGVHRHTRRAMGAARWLAAAGAVAAITATYVPSASASDHHGFEENEFTQTDLVSDQAGVAQIQDSNLVNAWGMSASPTSPLWVSDNGKDVTTLYTGANATTPAVTIVPLVVSIPGGEPTGQVFNPTTSFMVNGSPALFIFVSEAGRVTAWNRSLGTSAKDVGGVTDAVYKGLALAHNKNGDALYAANFHAGTIDVFDSSFMPTKTAGGFRDRHIPKGFAPFNIQEINGRLIVTYAKQDADAHDDVKGPGNGFVDVFNTDGFLLQRLVRRGPLNSPWGVALAPTGFGPFGGDLLIGNFGDGAINVFDMHGHFRGAFRDDHHKKVIIDGLWGLRFGNGTFATPNTLVFSAGPADESHGLLGTLAATDDDQRS